MIRKKEKGFALVLSLVLLMAMTLMGGALIVISASDHKSNNVSDEYQQTFYVAETALYEGEKYILNQFLGPYKSDGSGNRDLTKRNLPGNHTAVFDPSGSSSSVESCFYSFADIDNLTFKVLNGPDPDTPTSTTKVQVNKSKSYYDLLAPGDDGTIYKKPIADSVNINKANENREKLISKEETRLKKFKYEYFITRVGSAPFKGYGSSIKKDATDVGNDGMAYRIYGCGNYDDGKIIVPLESTLILPK
jgi:Tfp pilus assembly protein PilX